MKGAQEGGFVGGLVGFGKGLGGAVFKPAAGNLHPSYPGMMIDRVHQALSVSLDMHSKESMRKSRRTLDRVRRKTKPQVSWKLR